MKRFQFSLEQARHWRRLRADMERAKLESLYAEMRHLESQKLFLEAEETAAHDQVKNQDTVRAQQLCALDRFTRHSLGKKELLEQRRVELFAGIAQQQIRLLAAERDFELLAKLKEKKLEQWQGAFNREQEELASEVFLAKWDRQ